MMLWDKTELCGQKEKDLKASFTSLCSSERLTSCGAKPKLLGKYKDNIE